MACPALVGTTEAVQASTGITSFPLSVMSHPQSSSSSNFQLIFNNALKAYEKRTKDDLLAHPLAAQLQACDSPTAILSLLHRQVQEFNQAQNSDERLLKWLDPTVNVLYAFSATLGEGVGLIFSPGKVIFAGVGVLLLAAKGVQESQDTLADIFQRIECFFRRLEIYIQISATTEMKHIIIQIMVEVLCIIGIATKEIKESRTKKYVKKLFGRTDLEDALKRLDKLTHEEARMATAETLKVAHAVDERMKEVAENVLGIDDRVAGLDQQMANVNDNVASVSERVVSVDDRVAGVDDRVKAVDEKVAVVIDDGNEVKQNQLRESINKWLSPPDPSTNHNIAYAAHHKGTATWFSEGSIFQEWKTKGSFLWIYGKPGSGKSVLCSTIIQDIRALCEARQASMAYFYFDFRSANKQHLHDLIRSLLIQFSAHSDPLCNILSRLYEAHDNGKEQPSDIALTKCLQEMLSFQVRDQRPIYLIIDALDECPNTFGIPSPRERVLRLIKELIDLRLPHLYLCITSRPEIDIRNVFEPLTVFRVSLHNQSGQKRDIVDYVKSIVYSHSEPIMRRWRTEDKDLVVETLSERADGMFRWVFCQLEVLRHCLPSSVRRTLAELPESLDETYERVLREIKKPNRDHAHRVLQCLAVAVRPLQVEELAEVLAIDFDDSSGIAKLKPSWRWEDEEQALLSSCSSLIAVVRSGNSRIVQFSHFSVKEFLTSPRFATSSRDVLGFHIALKPAHTILGQACLSILLRTDDPVKKGVWKPSPLTQYAAQYWVTHAQFENVSSNLRRAMEYLFDLDKPYFAAWRLSHDIDYQPSPGATFYIYRPLKNSAAPPPLYYAALCGFHHLAEHLIGKYPQHVNSHGGYCVTPLAAALAGEYFDVAELLLRYGAGAAVNVRGNLERTPLHSAAYYGRVKVVRFLLEHNADVNSSDSSGWTPLHFPAADRDSQKGPDVLRLLADVAQLLLEYGADVNARRKDGSTPLHIAATCGKVEVARVLLEHGANIDEKNNEGKTPFQLAWKKGDKELITLLSEHDSRVSGIWEYATLYKFT